MNKHRAQKDILYISVSSFILIAAWIGFNLYHIYTTSTINQALQLQLDPIDPTFDQETIQKLKTRTDVAPLYELQITITPSPSPETSPAPEASQAAVPTNTIQGQ